MKSEGDTLDPQQVSNVIFEYAGRIGREQDREALIEVIANMGRDLVGADRCTIWLLDDSARQLIARFAHGTEMIPVGLNEGFVGRCVASGQVVMSNAPGEDARFASTVDQQTGYRTTSILTVPMFSSEGTMMGAFQALNKPAGFTQSDAELLALAAVYSARTIETQTLLRKAEASRRIERELEIARDVQQRLLAGARGHRVNGIDFVGTCRPALKVGGDYYDLLPLANDQVAVAIGDISGKGIAAALMMASVQATLHALILQNAASPAQLMARLNRNVVDASTGQYSTLFLALYDLRRRTLTTVNAGHCYPLILRNGQVQEAKVGGPPIGLLPDVEYHQQTYSLECGDVLVCYSDGLSETQNASGEFWSNEALSDAIVGAKDQPVDQLAESLMSAADAFAAGASQHDDMTVVCVRITA